MSRVKPGYFTDFNAFFTCSSEIDIFQGNRPASDVVRQQDGSSCPQDDGIVEGQIFQCFVSAQIPGGRAAVSNALSRLRQGYGGPRDNAFHLLSHPGNRLFPREKRVGCCSAFATKSFFLHSDQLPSKKIKETWTALTFVPFPLGPEMGIARLDSPEAASITAGSALARANASL